MERLASLLAESGSLSTSARMMLFALAGIMVVLLGAVTWLALALRRRHGVAPKALTAEPAEGEPDAGKGAVVCPTCRREYEGTMRFCPRDARALVPAAELVEGIRAAGSACPRCRRAFGPGLLFCPHDAAELVPASVARATGGEDEVDAEPGVIGRICPRCRRRYELGASFCGRDGAELASLN